VKKLANSYLIASAAVNEPSMLNTTKLSGHQEFSWHFFALDFIPTEGSSG